MEVGENYKITGHLDNSLFSFDHPLPKVGLQVGDAEPRGLPTDHSQIVYYHSVKRLH